MLGNNLVRLIENRHAGHAGIVFKQNITAATPPEFFVTGQKGLNGSRNRIHAYVEKNSRGKNADRVAAPIVCRATHSLKCFGETTELSTTPHYNW